MAHAADQIIDAFKALLVGMTTTPDAAVSRDSVYDISLDTAIVVRQGARAILEGEATFGRTQKWQQEIIVECHAKRLTTASPVLVAALNNMEAEVTAKVILNPPTLGGLLGTGYLEHVETGAVQLTPDEERPVGQLDARFSAVYRINTADPTVILP
jgi:hypothetical protein